MNADTKVNWSLKSGNTVSLWINYMPVVSGSKEAAAVSGSTVLRKGRNNVLVSAWFVSDPKPVLLEFTDESGLPVGGMGNDIGGMARRYQRMAESGDSSGAHDASSSAEASITFQLSYPGASEVALISDFNNWDPDATPMRLEKDGKWRVTVRLRRGVYQYKFLIDRKIKITDPAGASVEPDGFGGLNSTIDVR
jgi:hypothetical protein